MTCPSCNSPLEHINVMRAGKGNAVALKVNGKVAADNVVPLPTSGTTEVKVEVVVS